MRGFLAAGLLLMGAAGGAEASEHDASFARELPGDVSDVSAWEVVRGNFTSPGAAGRYAFYVNPRWQALYQLMRYRVRFTEDGDAAPTEKVVWNRRPGERVPLLVWERVAAREPAEWRALVPETAEYQVEMGRLLQILSVHRAVRAREAGGP